MGISIGCTLVTTFFLFTSVCSQNITIEDLLGVEEQQRELESSSGSITYTLLANSINRTLDPCEDFYSYVCDGWIADHPIPASKKEVNQLGDLTDRIREELQAEIDSTDKSNSTREQHLMKLYFEKCQANANSTSNEGVDALFRRLKWLQQNVVSLTDWLIEMHPEVAVVDVIVASDEYNSTVNILTLSPTSSFLSYATYFDPVYAEEYVAARRSLFDILKLLADDDQMKNMMNYSPEVMWRKVDNFFTVDKNLVKIIEESKAQPGSQGIPLVHLQKFLPSVNWLRYFSKIFPSPLVPSLQNQLVSLRDSFVIFKIEEMVNRLPPNWFLDYLEWKVIFHYMPFFSQKYDQVLENYNERVYGVVGKDVTKTCLLETVSVFSDVLGATWVQKHFEASTIPRVMGMVDVVRDSFLNLLDENTWMDQRTKEIARRKAYAIKPFVGFDPSYITEEKIKDNYALVNYNQESPYYYIVQSLKKNKIHLNFLLLNKFNRRDAFDAVPMEVNAFYDPSQNQIAVLAGILREPYFNPKWPDLLNYAGIGLVIGHEITHAFDNEGSFFDLFGNRVDWWLPETRSKFDDRKYCIQEQYGAIEAHNGVHVDGRQTLAENIADNGGMRMVLNAVLNSTQNLAVEGLEEFTKNQLFFMANSLTWCINQRPFALLNELATESHSPAKYRVNTVLSNQPEFASAFNCPIGSNMNPATKCTVW